MTDLIKINEPWWIRRIAADNYSSDLIVTAGYGSGKTFGGWWWLISQMVKYPEAKLWGFTEPTFGLIEKVAIRKFREIAALRGAIEGVHYSVVSGGVPKIRIHHTKQEILLLSLDRPESLVGFELCGCVEDEAALCSEEADTRLSSRLRGKGVPINQTLKITTPEGLNWCADKYDSDTLKSWKQIDEYDHFKTEKVITNSKTQFKTSRRFRLTTYMNESNLPVDYIANRYAEYGNNQNYIDSYIFGHFRPFTKGLAYKEFKSVLHKVDPIRPDKDKILNLTWDFNICPQWVAIQEQIDFDPYTRERRKFNVCIENANQDGETLTEAIAEFAAKFPQHKFSDTPIHLYGDASGQARSWKHEIKGDTDFIVIKRILNQLGYRAVVIQAHKPPNPLERLSVEAVNTAFMKGILLVASNCDRVLKSISRTTWANDQKARLDKPKNDTWTHPMDAVKYFIWAIDNNGIGNLI